MTCPTAAPGRTVPEQSVNLSNLTLAVVLSACPDIKPYAPDRLRDWSDLVATAARVRQMMGISRSAWDDAIGAMGPAAAAVTLAAILQRFYAIRNPGGYLRALTRRAAEGRFWPGPMIGALLAGGDGMLDS